MPTRYLKPGIRDSDRIEAIQDPEAEILFYRLLIVVDDFGRTDARPLMVKSSCFPIRLRVNADKCMQWLQMLDASRLIGLYEVDGKPYLQIAKWDNKPRAITSKFPDPPTDVCKRMQMLPVTVTVTETGNRKPELKPKPETGTRADARATRLPADWNPLPEDIDFCKTERPDLNPQSVAASFKDFWVAVPGAKGRKLDWQATWRNWVRNQRGVNAKGTVGNAAAFEEAERLIFGDKKEDIPGESKRV